jgi:phosphoadenosine phosphosulfate reductase
MPRDLAPGVADRVAALNVRWRHHGATAVLEHALHDPDLGRVALVSSFGAESVVLLHLVSVIAPETPVLFIDTRMLFPETLAYQRDLAERLHLCDLRTIRAPQPRVAFDDPDGTLHQVNPDACCALRKVAPLERALAGFDGWITGRKRFQGAGRESVEFFEAEGEARIKVNPLAHWGRQDVEDYMVENRAGRWRGQAKVECGIHFVGGKAVRVRREDAA